MSIKQNLIAIKNHIPSSVLLLAVSKGQPVEKIKEAILAGQFAFGENYLQEALPKITMLSDYNLEWHFIGLIQQNKTKKIAENFSWVHSVSSAAIAKRLNDQRPLALEPLNICLQINRAGMDFDELRALAEYCVALPRLKLRGLMVVPVPTQDILEQRVVFSNIRVLYERLNKNNFSLDTLSMGMSADMDAAIAEGATLVRIGTAIFGSRN